MNSGGLQRGFLMLPVVICLTLLAAIVFMMNRDAGMGASLAGRGLDADAARYAAEAGLSRMKYKAQNSSCTGYGSLSSVTFGTDNFSASASPASGSPVTLTATGTTAGGATATLTRTNVVVLQTTTSTLTLQPGPFGIDTYISAGGNATKNFGSANALKLDGGKERALLQFDLTSIPATSYIESAQLMMWKSGGGGGSSDSTITVYPLTQTWTEGNVDGGSPGDGATWNTSNGSTAWTPGGAYDASSGIAVGSPGGNDFWLTWEIGSIVSKWVEGASVNNGLLVLPSDKVPGQTYIAGDDAGQSTRWPKLVVTFRPPCGWTPLQIVTLSPTADGQINGTSANTNYGSSNGMVAYDTGSRRALALFSTSGIPAGTPLISAKLRLYISNISSRSGSNMTIQLRALTQPWAESTFTWNRRTSTLLWTTPGGDMAGSDAATLNLPASFNSGWIELDITALTQAWVDGVTANNGVIFSHLLSDQINFATKEDGPANAPQLVVTY